MPLSVSVSRDSAETIVAARGDVDLLTAPMLQNAVDTALAARQPIALDLRGVGFMDSTGLRTLVEAHGRATRGDAGLRLVLGESHNVRRLLDITGMLDRFDVS